MANSRVVTLRVDEALYAAIDSVRKRWNAKLRKAGVKLDQGIKQADLLRMLLHEGCAALKGKL